MHRGQLIKRIVDIMISSCAILILLPLWLLISLCIFIESPGPILYRQIRIGKNQELFSMIKFRSMVVNTISPLALGAIKHKHPLVTSVGYVIRRFKLDETPQFYQVLKGEMSLVGPRPCLPERIPQLSLVQRRRFLVSPGLTGWAEVNGNVDLSFQEQLLLDLWYVDHWSLKLDCRILLRTLKVVICGANKNEKALFNAKKHAYSYSRSSS